MIEPGTRGHHQAFSQKTIILYYYIISTTQVQLVIVIYILFNQ